MILSARCSPPASCTRRPLSCSAARGDT